MVSVLRSLGEGLSERKWSETVVGLEEGVGLSTGRQCSLTDHTKKKLRVR